MNKFIVAIHGIGNQRRSATIRTVATRFGKFLDPSCPVEPLGYYNLGQNGGFSEAPPALHDPAVQVGVAEVYWADIPRDLAHEDDTLDESKEWARTVADRAKAVARHVPGLQPPQLDKSFAQAAGVIEEIVEGVAVLENLTALAAKAGIFKFELGALLADMVGGIQVVADFQLYRDEILGRFHAALNQVVAGALGYCRADDIEVYIVAHSEGSVISFAAIMQALLSQPGADADWIKYLRGFMTIGSPIDKHILLWPPMWQSIGLTRPPMSVNDPKPKFRPFPEGQIRWVNYYDLADPIGYNLTEARKYLRYLGCTAFDCGTADSEYDYGFSRYLLPGAAHVGYWKDNWVFGHFFQTVVYPNGAARNPNPKFNAPPKTKPWVRRISIGVPYFLAFLANLLAIAFLVSAVNQSMKQQASLPTVLWISAGLWALLTGTTVAARLPRIAGKAARVLGTRVLALVSFPAGVIGFWLALWVSDLRCLHFEATCIGWPPIHPSLWIVPPVFCFLIVVFAGWRPHKPRTGRRWLMIPVAVLAAAMTIAALSSGLHPDKSLLPLALSYVAFIYLWWLGIILFDLTYIWHHYVFQGEALKSLRTWASQNPYP